MSGHAAGQWGSYDTVGTLHTVRRAYDRKCSDVLRAVFECCSVSDTALPSMQQEQGKSRSCITILTPFSSKARAPLVAPSFSPPAPLLVLRRLKTHS